ncbi:cupin-like domain-containing protein [Xenorhabdus griffiniae]|uniref:Cupin-like domain-containing protein n=1 Tax=Xenorhabdus griffiniae TaxID=351672 RepID=A0ABY9XMQ7_9GAMM|nr:cupin-like domain-containing protein [Xenorhabdus griffiniae]MBD1227093.1 cupin-like domain-containing protein [Xenorhabdus griffiniae]MBE8586732.1 cupin-like domain-containing protein [Xenorhabdus griffiniae]WMV74109.1 cupin-like domain-containing protein [Xenorhabdus griffiniae]WNH03789.1 cupin-like domain-containing protein [Xenorhabdus griffiniae]
MTTSYSNYDYVDLPEKERLEYERIFFLRNFFLQPDLFQNELKQAEQNMVFALPVLESGYSEIETYEPGELTWQKLAQIYAEDIRPVVIKGFASSFPCGQLWTPEYFRDNFGDFQLWYSTTEKLFEEDGTSLRDYINGVLKGDISRAYLENLSDIFNKYPILHQQIGIDRIGNFLGDFASYHKIAQLFIGGPGTGAVYHCANELNCFLNIYGRKEWIFVHPKYSAAMYSSMFNKGIFVGSFVKHNAPVRYLEEHQPLYNRIPKLRITLEPGDMLINPPWWWHAINNQPPVSIAIASRWKIEMPYQHQNPLYEFVQSQRMERLTLEGKKMADSDVVVPDSELRKKYVSYKEMGWVGN